MKLKSEIKKIDFGSNAELDEVQNLAIEFAKNSTEFLLEGYNKHPDTMGGRYICSDTFKELFPIFKIKENRALVNDAIHNSSAVLAATQFEEVLKRDEPNKTKAIFITGIPGAGKTTLMYTTLFRFLNDRQKFVQSYIRLQLLKKGLTWEEILAAPVMRAEEYAHFENLALQEFYQDI